MQNIEYAQVDGHRQCLPGVWGLSPQILFITAVWEGGKGQTQTLSAGFMREGDSNLMFVPQPCGTDGEGSPQISF